LAASEDFLVDSVHQLLSEWARERPDIDASPVALFARVIRISALVTRSAEQWLHPLGLTWESFSLIVTLRRAGEPFQQRPLELLQDSLLSSGAMTNRIHRLEAMGLVKRLRDPNDRRGRHRPTHSEGIKLADRAFEVHVSELRLLLKGLVSGDRRALSKRGGLARRQ
jgi:DNA-binding MarR family transcriptional regulator